MKIQIPLFSLIIAITLHSPMVLSKEYQSPSEFIERSFNQQASESKVLWLDKGTKKTIESILGHRFKKLRIRYSLYNDETVWILNEIGKEAPITVGIHVKNNAIVKTKVLVYRESRGDEVRHDFFTSQFIGAKLNQQLELTKHIDGISGATLSVRALKKVSKIALLLHDKVVNSDKSD